MTSNKRVFIYGTVIAALVLLMLGLCFSECSPSGSCSNADPAECVDAFMSAIVQNNEADAVACLYNCDSLGLSPDGESAYPDIYTELHEGIRWNILRVEHLSATLCRVTVNFNYLDLALYEAALRERVLSAAADTLHTSEEDYRELTALCMQQLQPELKSFYTARVVSIDLVYSGGKWQIVLDNELYSVLTGETQPKG